MPLLEEQYHQLNGIENVGNSGGQVGGWVRNLELANFNLGGQPDC